MTILKRKAVNFCLAATALAFMNSSCFAYLGGFEPNDGYQGAINPVETYDAG